MLRMWPRTLKLHKEKSKYARMAQENGFAPVNMRSLLRKSVINTIWLLLPVSQNVGRHGKTTWLPNLCFTGRGSKPLHAERSRGRVRAWVVPAIIMMQSLLKRPPFPPVFVACSSSSLFFSPPSLSRTNMSSAVNSLSHSFPTPAAAAALSSGKSFVCRAQEQEDKELLVKPSENNGEIAAGIYLMIHLSSLV